jgi:hypothetical protein
MKDSMNEVRRLYARFIVISLFHQNLSLSFDNKSPASLDLETALSLTSIFPILSFSFFM